MIKTATPDNLATLTANGLTWVDFWAPWCGPCKALEPELASLEKEFGDRIQFLRFNVDGAQDVAKRYHVMSVPSLVLFRDGRATEKVTGIYPRDKYAKYLKAKIDQ